MSDNLQLIFESDDDGLLNAVEKAALITNVDRLERSFREIVDFRRERGRLPSPDTREIAERKLGARLDGILANDAKVAALRPLDDEFGLLEAPEAPASLDDLLDGDAGDLLGDASGLLDLSDLPRAPRTGPVDVAQRVKSADFATFETMFVQKHAELADGRARRAKYSGIGQIVEGAFFIVSGLMAFVADVHESEPSAAGQQKQRLRCIFENGTESSMYRQSLSTRLYEDSGEVVVDADPDLLLPEDEATGWVYVLRSLSDDPQISALENLYKIGFSHGPVAARIARAEHEPTYLMAPVEIVAEYRTYNMKTSRLEHLLHRVFADVRLDIGQVGKDGRTYAPSEWFVAPLGAIDAAIDSIMSGGIVGLVFNATTAALEPAGSDR